MGAALRTPGPPADLEWFDPSLRANVDAGYHALALDEARGVSGEILSSALLHLFEPRLPLWQPFQPMIWDLESSRAIRPDRTVHQVIY